MKHAPQLRPVLGVRHGNRDFFPGQLVTEARRDVAKVPRLQCLLRHVCRQGFEHHVVMTQSKSAGILAEAFGNYSAGKSTSTTRRWNEYAHCRVN